MGAGSDAGVEVTLARVAERFPADLERIRDYLRLPSVSATGEGVRAAAEATGALVERAGGSFELVETPGHPVLVDELPGPAVVARGSANSKGCLAAFFLAVEVLRELGTMPATVALLVEGKEELGSPHLPAVARRLAGDLAAAAAFDLDLTAGPDLGPGPGPDDATLLAELTDGFDPQAHLREARAARYRLDGGPAELLEAYPWAKAPPDNPADLALRASYRLLGRQPLPYPLAPWCAPYFVFHRVLGLPWAAGGVGHAAGAHGPDEYATVAGLKEHIVGAAAFLLAAAEPGG